MCVCVCVCVDRFVATTVDTVAQWFRYCATNREVAGSNPGGIIGIFH